MAAIVPTVGRATITRLLRRLHRRRRHHHLCHHHRPAHQTPPRPRRQHRRPRCSIYVHRAIVPTPLRRRWNADAQPPCWAWRTPLQQTTDRTQQLMILPGATTSQDRSSSTMDPTLALAPTMTRASAAVLALHRHLRLRRVHLRRRRLLFHPLAATKFLP